MIVEKKVDRRNSHPFDRLSSLHTTASETSRSVHHRSTALSTMPTAPFHVSFNGSVGGSQRYEIEKLVDGSPVRASAG